MLKYHYSWISSNIHYCKKKKKKKKKGFRTAEYNGLLEPLTFLNPKPCEWCVYFQSFPPLRRDGIFIDGDREEMLLLFFLVRAQKHFLSRTEQNHSDCSKNAISIWLRAVIIEVYRLATDGNFTTAKMMTHELCSIGASQQRRWWYMSSVALEPLSSSGDTAV